MNPKTRIGPAVTRLLAALVVATPAVGQVTHEQPTSSASLHSAVVVPFELHSNNILVRTQLNGIEAAWFVFDTGASLNVVDANWAAKAGLKVTGSSELVAGGGTVQGTFAEDVSITLTGLDVTHQVFAIVPLEGMRPLFGRNVRGLLGNTFIKDYVVGIDYLNEELTFYPPAHRRLSDDPKALPIQNRGGTPYVELQLSLDDGAPISGLFEIDSGSSSALHLNRPFADEHRIIERIPPARRVEGPGGAGLGGDMKSTDARIESVRWSDHIFEKPIISVSQDTAGFGSGEEAGFLGGEILRRFNVVLDYGSMRVLLTPNSTFSDSFETDMSGLELMTAADNFQEIRIKNVRAGFPAAQLGLKAGDVIVSIDGQPAGELSLHEWALLLRRDNATWLMVIRRGGDVFPIKLELRRVI